jgi:hypothetical protein
MVILFVMGFEIGQKLPGSLLDRKLMLILAIEDASGGVPDSWGSGLVVIFGWREGLRVVEGRRRPWS